MRNCFINILQSKWQCLKIARIVLGWKIQYP